MSWWIRTSAICPAFAAGAHVSVRVGDGPVRDFSLWNDPAERTRYCIAVLREPEGRGSREWHEQVRVGDIVEASTPRNNFPLAAKAEHHLLIAGGIGITPIMAMIAELRRRRADFRLHYCTRSPEETAFLDDLAMLAAQGRVQFHHDGGDPARGLDIAGTLQRIPARHPSLLLRPRGNDGGHRSGLEALAAGNRALRIFSRGRRRAADAARGSIVIPAERAPVPSRRR